MAACEMLTFLSYHDGKSDRYLCECGKITVKQRYHVKSGNTRSCGCIQAAFLASGNRRTHGMSHTSIHNTWCSTRQRCYDTRCKSYPNYGGRGIKVCERWHIFENFYADMGLKLSKEYCMERVNNDGDYEPGNVIWSTVVPQANNKRTVPLIQTPLGRMSVSQAARAYGVKRTTLRQRLDSGWLIEKALGLEVQNAR